MARQRSYAAEYARRLELGRQRGETTAEARGHRRAPERPIAALRNPERWVSYIQRRFDAVSALAQTAPGKAALARVNQRRARDGKGPIVIDYPPYPGPGARQTTFESFGEAEPHGQGIPPDYTTYYLSPEGVTLEIRRGVRHHRRAA